MPWSKGKRQLTESYAGFLSGWAKWLSWKEVAEVSYTSCDHVFSSVEMAVDWGKAHRELTGIKAIGVDEIQWQRGHKYLTLVYQIDTDCRRLLWVGQHGTIKTLLRFFREFGKERSEQLDYVCSGIVEGFNNKAKLTTRKAYGFRTFYAAQIALYHTLGSLPLPETTLKVF